MHYLITGITGFAGPHLANLLLKHGHSVTGLVRHSNGRETDILDVMSPEDFSQIKFVYSDLTNYRTLREAIASSKFDGVFHLAAQSHPPSSFADPIGTWDANVVGSINLIQAVSDTYGLDCKLMFCSTSEVYGNVGSDGRKITTGDALLPSNPYGASKAAIDLYMQERIENQKIRGFITRAFSHTGPRRGKTFSISSDAYQLAQIICAGKQEEHNTLLVGNLDSVRVVLDVRDIVDAYYKLMLADSNRVFNVSGDTPHKMGVYTDILISLSGLKSVEKKIHPQFYRPIDIHYQHGDTSDLTAVTDWAPKFSLQKTMTDLLDYWVRKLRSGRQ